MAYTITLTDGNIFAVVADGTINTSSSMTLVGKNYAGYGQFLDENFIHLLENGANTTAPTAPLTGQLWYNSTAGILQVWNGSGWKSLGGATSSSSAPSNNITGDLWYNTATQQLNVWTGSAWLLVGPSFTAGTGKTGAIVATIVDNLSISHVVVELYVQDSIVGIVSKDAAFTPQVAISGFTQVLPGITLASTISGVSQLFQGTATNSQALNSLTSAQFMRADANTATTGTLSATGNVTTAGTFLGSALNITTGTATIGNIINGNGNGVGNIGSSSNYFNTVFAQATSAQYADVAERFAADQEYEAGTVVELGGSAEITCSRTDLSESVFGVISTRAAYLMNSAAGSDSTHPPVAMTGRVPVRATGVVHKGDRLVSAGNGLARAALPGEATAFNVIGRALKDKLTADEGMVEAIVTIK